MSCIERCSLAVLVLALLAAEPRRLTTDGRLKFDPVFVDRGTAVVYTLQETPALQALMKLKLADGSVQRLHPDATTAEFEPTFAADESIYAFIQSRGNLNLKLVLRDVKQNRDAVFDPGGGFASLRRPSFAPDGSRVVFSLPAATGSEIVSVNRQGQDKITLTRDGLNNWPAWSPDGKTIAFCSSRDGDYDLYTMNAYGSDVKRLLKSPGLEARPAWSPDGKRLAFTSNRDGNYEIYVIHRDGSGLRRLTSNPERDDYAAWHPDGKRLIHVEERKGKFDLALIDVGE